MKGCSICGFCLPSRPWPKLSKKCGKVNDLHALIPMQETESKIVYIVFTTASFKKKFGG